MPALLLPHSPAIYQAHIEEFVMRHLAFEKFVGGTALALGLIMMVGVYV